MKSRFLAVAFTLFGFSSSSMGAYTVSTLIDRVTFFSTGVVVINVSPVTASNQPNGFPPCATYTRYALDATTPGGKVLYSGLMTAFALGKHVQIYGNNLCDVDPYSETLTSFLTLD